MREQERDSRVRMLKLYWHSPSKMAEVVPLGILLVVPAEAAHTNPEAPQRRGKSGLCGVQHHAVCFYRGGPMELSKVELDQGTRWMKLF